MKKPTFSNFFVLIFSLFENLFQKSVSLNFSISKELRDLKKSFLQRNSFSIMQNRIAVLLFLFFLITTLSSFSNVESSSLLSLVNAKSIEVKVDTLVIGADSLKNKITVTNGKALISNTAAEITNPLIKYATNSYAGQVSQCPNDGDLLPKLFLCGGNDSRLIQTGITDARSIIWERFISGGSCTTVSNSDCANKNALASCWVAVPSVAGTQGQDYLANSAGQFRVKITDSTGTLYTFYFNVYQNALIPTAVAKNNIVKYGATCVIPGKITVGGFGDGYQYSFTTGSTPGAWNDSNVFTTTTPGTYTAFIRLKNVVGACEFKVINLEINSLDFTVSTVITAPKCNGDKGSVNVVASNVGLQYKYEIYNNATTLSAGSSGGYIKDTAKLFTGLTPGTYTIKTYVEGTSCMVDIQTNVVVPAAPAALTINLVPTALAVCTPGKIRVDATGGTTFYRYWVNINNAGFVLNSDKNITVVQPGTYEVRVEDTNGCSISKTIIVDPVDKPVYTITKTAGTCTNPNGSITVTLSDRKSYSYINVKIDGGSLAAGTYQTVTGTTYVFNNLPPENYIISIEYKKSRNDSYCIDPDAPISIGQTTALTASAGVAELSGCGPVGKELQGKVRITNAEGGVPISGTNPYLYSFDGKATWVTTKEAYVDPRTHILYIKDANCEVALAPITLETKPAAPTISVDAPVFNCDGSATSTVTVTNSGSGSPQFSYDYYMDGVLNTSSPSNIFKNVTQGDHTITVSYNVLSVPTESVLLNESFGSGPDVSSPGINPNFCWERQVEATKCNGDRLFGNGEYTVTNSLKNNPYSGWHNPVDHTSGSANGRYLAVDAGNSIPNNAVLYRKTIKDIIPNQPIKVTFVGTNLLKVGNTQPDASLTVELQNSAGVALSSQSTGGIPKTNGWVEYTKTINPGNNTTLDFVLRLELSQVNGIDFAVDDLVVTQMPKACNTVASFPLVVDGSKAFSAGITGYKDVKCSGQSNGEITISAQNFDKVKGFQYSVDGGAWQTVIPVPASTSGSKTLTNLGSKIYNISIRYDSAAGSCTFPFSKEIKAPAALTVSASVTKIATCTTGATITAVGGGGTSPYQYELRKSDGITVVAPFSFSNNAVFTGVPVGNYTVFARDINLCVSNVVGVPVSVVNPPAVTATLDATTDWCYTSANPASLVVNASGGVGPYSYALDGNANTPANSKTFSNVAPGTHSIVVTDSNGCTATISNIVISPPLKLNAVLTQDLTCLVSASITATVTDGYAGPYTYKVSYNGATATTVASFPYTTTLAGTYVFTVTDSKSCPATSNTIIVSSKTTPTLTANKTDITCNNKNDGIITVTAGNGFTSSYTYAIKLNTAATYTTKTTNQFTGLAAGTYNIKVIDSKGCESAVTDVTIINPTVVGGTISATELGCSSTGTVAAKITVIGSGGVGPYEYSFNDANHFGSDNIYFTSTPETVTAYIRDKNGCQFGPLSKTISANTLIAGIDVFFETGLECPAYKAHVKFQAIGGLSPIRYQVIAVPSGISIPIEASGQYSLDPGDYVFTAIDRNGCSVERRYHVKDVPDIVAGGSVLTPIKCFGDKGTIEFTVTGVKDRGYDYVIKNASGGIVQQDDNISETITTVNVPTALPVGVYTITATDRKTKCTGTYAVNLTQPTAALSISSASATHVNCNDKNSNITVTASGGTTNYSYAAVKTGAAVPTAFAAGNVVTVNTNSGADLVWDVYVKDANACTVKTTVTVIKDAIPSVTAVVSNQCTASGNNFTITATGTGGIGTLTYGINGAAGAFQSANTFTVAASATPYTVWVKDGNQCTASAAAVTVYPELTTLTSTKVLDCSTSPDAVITTTITGGKAPYTYTVQKGTGTISAPSASSSSLTFTYNVSNANAGAYKFVITDANGCTSIATATVTAITNPTVSETHINVSCNGLSDGSVTLTGAGGSGGYTYSRNATSGFTATATFSGLAASATAYTFYVKDSKGCTGSVSVTITQPTALVVSASATSLSCNATNVKQSALVTINVPTTGTSPYEYSFNGGAYDAARTLTVNDNGSNQTINYSVKDSKGCIKAGTAIIINKLNKPTDLTFANAVVTCSAPTTTVTVTAVNGVGTLQYETIAPSVVILGKQPSNIFAGLAAGAYTFKVTDANGCYYSELHTIDAVTPIAITGNVDLNVDCKGNSTGKATFTVSGNVTAGAYTFALTSGTLGTGTLTKSGNTLTLANVKAGNYKVQVTDTATGCSDDYPVTIKEPIAALSIASAAATHVNCNDYNSNITITASGGTTNYGYAAVKTGAAAPTAFATSNVVTVNTNSGADLVWDVYVKDANACTVKTTVTIIKDAIPSVTAVVSNQCTASGNNFTITATGTGGIGTLTYGINGAAGAFQSANTFTVAASATPYTVWVKDGNQCTASTTPITVYPQLTASADVTNTLDCSTSPDAVITTTITGGKAPYTYTVQKGTGAVSAPSASSSSLTFTYNVSNANAGAYKFVITDANGCTAIATATVTAITNPTVTAAPTQVSCNGLSNGSVTLTGAGGSGGYTYSRNATSGFTTSPTFSGLAASATAYTFYVKDSKGCTGSVSVTITQPTVLAVSASATSLSCNASNVKQSALVTINVPTTGTAPYEYSFNGGAYDSARTLTVYDNGSNQTINYSVKDSKGCIQAGTAVTINKLNPPAISNIVHTPIYCLPVASTTSTVTITKTAGTGTGTITYAITAPSTAVTSNTTGVFNGLAGGTTYTFKVTDANGCYDIDTHNVPVGIQIAVTATKLSDADCFGSNAGSIRYNVSGFTTTYSYSVNGGTAVLGQTAAEFTLPNLIKGSYNVLFTDETTKCTISKPITINGPTTALSATVAQVNANCNVATSKVTVTPTGGTAPYTFAYKINGVAPGANDYVGTTNIGNLNPTTSLSWDVWVKDSQECTFKLDVTVAKDLDPTVSASVLNQCTASGSTFQIKAVGASGVGPYTYTINTGVAPSPADTFTVPAGTYTITVKDANSCPNTISVTVNDALDTDAILKKDLTCSTPASAQIDVTINGGKANFSYKVKFNGGVYGSSTAVTGNTFTSNPTVAGTYQFEITDANGCKKETNVITVNPIVNPVITSVTETQSIKCNGDNTGILTVNIDTTKGLGPFTYSINGTTYQSSNIFTGLIAGTYSVTVKDSKGCINPVPYSAPIAQPNPITFTLSNVEIKCNASSGSSLGSITVSNVLGGTGSVATPFKYFITNNFGDVIAGNPYTATTTGRENHTFTIINYGVYTINVVDANGCSLTQKITMASPPTDLDINVTSLASNCTTGGTAKVEVKTLIASGNYEFGILESNISPYTTTWFAPDALGGKIKTFTNLVPGVTYTFVVHDKTTQCYYVEAASAPILPASALTAVPIAKNVTCQGLNNGSVTFTLSGFYSTTTSIDYQIFSAFSNVAVGAVGNKIVTGAPPYTVTAPSPGALSPGQYYIKFIENGTGAFNGCKSASAIFEIKESSIPLTVSASVIKNENCDNLGIITALAKFGTAPYLYMITGSATAPSATDSAWNSASTFTKAAGTYYVHAKDAYGCIQPSAIVNLIKDPAPVIALSVVNKCVVEGTFSINVNRTTAGIGTHSISVDNSTFTNVTVWPHIITGLNSGLHTIKIKDANGCIDTESITISKPLVATAAITTLPTCANNDGVITMSGNGGTGPYTYTIVPMPVGVTIVANVISKLPAGTYTVTMTDKTIPTTTPTNCSTTASVTLIAPTAVTFTTVTTPVVCSGDSNGVITVNLGTGNNNPNYTYEITAGPTTRIAQASNVFSGLLAGTYTVKVNSGRGCSDIKNNVIVGSPTPLRASSILTTPLTCGAANAAQPATVTVTATPGTGTAPYEYSFDLGVNYSSTNTYQSYVGRTFNVYVKDANECIYILSNGVNIPVLDAPTGMDITGTAVYCSPAVRQTSTVSITNVVKGVGTKTYSILSPTSAVGNITGQSSGVFTGLVPDTYTFQVKDANGCTYQESYTVDSVTPIAIVGALASDISCNVANGINNNGSAKFTVTGFSASGNYTIAVSSVPAALPYTQLPLSGDVITLTGLRAGTYTVTVTDRTTGCTKSASVPFVEPVAIAFTAVGTKVFCSQDISQITVSGVTGGTGVYSYAVVKGGATAPVSSAYLLNSNVLSVDTNLTDLSWDVYVKDANGCIQKKNVVVTKNLPPTITVPTQQCYTGSNLTVNLSTLTTTYNGVKSYTVNNSAITGPTATFNGPGTYTLGIKDDNGCEAFVTYKIEKQLTAFARVTKELFCAAPINATIAVAITDGVAPYSYQMYVGGVATGSLTPVTGSSFTASVSASGTYHFVIKDSNAAACSVTTANVVVTTPSTPAAAFVQTNVSCNGGADGTITITGSNGVEPYLYSIDNGANFQTSNYFIGLTDAGVYKVVVQDAKLCKSVAIPVDITQPTAVAANISVTTGLSCGTGNDTQQATVTVNGSGGTLPYQYSFDGINYSSINTFTTNAAGLVKAWVKDGNRCNITAAVSTNVAPLNPPTGMDINGTAVYCSPAARQTSTVSITNVVNGVGTKTYSILSPTTAVGNITGKSSGVFTGLLPDTYTFQVKDANGCTYQESYTVDSVTPIAIVGALASDISCNVANGINNNGSAKFTVTGFSASGNYTIAVSSVPAALPYTQLPLSGDVITLTGLRAGTYTVTVTDRTTGCTKSASVPFVEPVAIAFTAVGTKVFCSQDISQITVSGVTGGTGVYSYAVVKGGATAPVSSAYLLNSNVLSVDTNLTDLSWDVYVKDANGCIQKKNVVVTKNLPPTITVPTQQCYTGSNLTVNLSTLTTTYNGVKSYTVNNSAITGPTATFNGPGTYTLGIKDDNGCEAFVTYKIEKQLTAFARVTKELFCAAPINATIAVAITDGVAPYSYQMYVGGVSTGSLTPVTGSSFTASVSAGGTYSFVITDSNAVKCSVTTANVVVTTPSTPRAAFVQTNVSCNGGADGTITITGSNGVEPYLYSINNGVSFQASNYFTGLTDAGVYKVVVKDAKLCTSVAIPVDITQPTAVTARAVVTPFGCNTANTQQDAIVTLTPGGGTPGYKYSFNGGATYQASASFVVNAAKTINYVIQDANGCTASGSAVVTAYTPPTDMNLAVTPIYCNTPGTVATLTVNSVTGGVAPYTYGIISPIVSATNTTGTFSNLAPNTYIVKVTDANGCSTTKAILIKKANNISVIAQLINDVSCRGGFNGAVNFTVSNYITAGSYSFGLTPAAGAFTKTGDIIKYTGLPAGNYTFNVTDGVSGCVASVTNFTISQPAAVLDFTAVATNINCDVKTSLITVTATGGTVSYSYAAVPTGTGAPTAYSADNRLLVDTNNGTVMGWDVYVKDRNGCSLSKLKTILLDVTPMITSAVATQCPSSTGTYNITVSATGFSTALQYSVGGVSFQTGNIITVNTPGNYNVIVKDANGCSSAPTAVTILDPLQLKFDITTSPICNGNEGVVTLTVTGGTVAANYVYSKDNWVTSQSSPVFAGLIPNMYIFSVRDTGTACTKSVTAVIETPNRAIDFTLPKTDVICKGESNGTVTVAMATTTTTVNNNPVYTYAISPSPIGMVLVGNVFTNLPANTYTVTVTSGKGCPVSKVVTVGEPLAISVATPIVTEYGCTTGNGTNYATISVGLPTGGSGTYTVYEFLRDGNPNPVQKGVNPVYIESDLLGGNYIINVYDNRGCVGTTSTTIDAFIGIDFATPSSINVTKAITCINDEDIQVNVVIKGGAPVPLDYTIVASATNAKPYASVTNTSGQFTNLTVGSYIITVKNPSTGCSIKTIHYVNEPNTFDLAVSNIKNVVCYGSATGSVDLNFVDNQLVPTNDAGVFDYTIAGPVSISARSTDAGPITIPNLPAGVYTVTAKLVGLPSCDVVTTFTIDQPTLALTISENHTPITCDPGNDGTISVTADGGWPGTYQYELVGPVNVAYSTDFYFDNLKAGTYILNVKDVNGCVATTTVTLSVPSPILVSASATSSLLLCNGDTSGEIRVNTPTGGQGSNYSYILNYASANPVISSAPQTSPVFSGLGAGTYTITVIDGLGCVSAPSADIIIAEPTKVEASLVLATAITCLSSATVTLSVTGGTGPYEYSTDKNFAPGSLTTLTSVPFSVGLGDHQYYVRDVNGCVGFISNTVKINALTPLSLDLDLSNAIINCNGAATGAIDSKAFGGLGNYVYTLLNATKNPISPAQATGYFDALLAGTYYVRVDSGDCQYDSDVITIAQPTTALGTVVTTTPVTCNGIGNGTIVVIGSGGTNPIGYAISPNLNQYFDTGSFINLKPGVYDIVTQDKNGCFVKDQATITEPNLIVANVVPSSIQQEICVGEKTGAFDITIVGGIPPYSTSIDGDPFVPNRITFSGLSGGNHMVIVKDANLCESELEVPLDKAVILNPVAMVSNECVNNSPANKVIVEIDESNNAADVTYSLDDTGIEQVSNVFTNLAPGDHYVMVHHKNTCIDATEAFTIDQIDPLTISIDLGGLNEIVATVTGGSGIYQYMINGESIGSNNKYFYYRSGDYTVTVIDSNGCSASITKYFEFIDIKIPPIFTPTGDGTNDSWKPTNTENYPDIKFVVYDRYGREVGVFGAGQSWDGKYNGTELPMGDYWYVLKLRHTQDDREFIGHFTLYR